MTTFPNKRLLSEAVIEVLTKMGGSGSVREIDAGVIQLLQLPQEIVEQEDESGIGTKLSYDLRWVRTQLKLDGKLENKQRGIWGIKSC